MKTTIALLEVLDHHLLQTKIELSIPVINIPNKLSDIYESSPFICKMTLFVLGCGSLLDLRLL